MQTERRFKIDKYLEMARITKSEHKREHFLDMAEHYLETEEQKASVVKNDAIEWIEMCGKEFFHRLPIATAFEEYTQYAKKNGLSLTTKRMLSKDIKEFYQLDSKMINLGREGSHRCYFDPKIL